jgi:hypothetical protein
MPGVKPRNPLCAYCMIRMETWISGVEYKCPKCGRRIMKDSVDYEAAMELRKKADLLSRVICSGSCVTDGTLCGYFQTQDCPHPIIAQRAYAKHKVVQ